MPINEIRDTIQGTMTISGSGVGYMTRCINLKDGFRNQIMSIDMFNDNLLIVHQAEDPKPSAYQLFVSPFPMQQTTEFWSPSTFPTAGAMAGDEQVLYKESCLTKSDIVNTQNTTFLNRFPKPELAATPTTNWYSPHLYITILYWGLPATEVDVKFSLFIRVKQTKASMVSASMGQYKEFLDSQCRKLSEMGVVYNPLRIPGYTFPMWKHGGIRPELMISGTTALRYFNRVAANANQEMTTRTALQSAYSSATGMVNFDEAFGDAALNLPEWITLMDVAGVTSGIIRPYPPPLKYADNGNTLMF